MTALYGFTIALTALVFTSENGHCQQQLKTAGVQEDPCKVKSKVVADVTYCDRYWECVDGQPELYDCPNGLVFAGKYRGVTEGCDYPWRADYCENKQLANGPISREHCDWLYGIFGHETSCTRYWTCWNGTATEQLCIGGLLYNENTRSCDWPNNVEGCQKHPLCNEEPNGNVPLGKSCNRYWQCQGGYPRLQRCPAMLVFDKRSLRCVIPPTEDCDVPTTPPPNPDDLQEQQQQEEDDSNIPQPSSKPVAVLPPVSRGPTQAQHKQTQYQQAQYQQAQQQHPQHQHTQQQHTQQQHSPQQQSQQRAPSSVSQPQQAPQLQRTQTPASQPLQGQQQRQQFPQQRLQPQQFQLPLQQQQPQSQQPPQLQLPSQLQAQSPQQPILLQSSPSPVQQITQQQRREETYNPSTGQTAAPRNSRPSSK